MFQVTGWRNGPEGSDVFYGLRVRPADRQRFFRRGWTNVRLHLPGHGVAVIPLSPSFWRSCPELRSEQIGRWLRAIGAAPWRPHNPPRFWLQPAGDANFRIDAQEIVVS